MPEEEMAKMCAITLVGDDQDPVYPEVDDAAELKGGTFVFATVSFCRHTLALNLFLSTSDSIPEVRSARMGAVKSVSSQMIWGSLATSGFFSWSKMVGRFFLQSAMLNVHDDGTQEAPSLHVELRALNGATHPLQEAA